MPRTKNNAFLNRIHVRAWLLAALVGGFSVTSQAGYAQLAPPAGFAGTSGNWTFAPAANQPTFGNVLHQPNALRVPVPGSVATMPVSYRLAANAPRIAAAAIFMNPYVRAGVGIASWLGFAGIVWDAVNNRWSKPDTSAYLGVSDGKEYQTAGSNSSWHLLPGESCDAYAQSNSSTNSVFKVVYIVKEVIPSQCKFQRIQTYVQPPNAGLVESDREIIVALANRVSSCPSGWYVTPGGCVQTPPVKTLTEPDFVEDLSVKPMPSTVPTELPRPTPLPVEQPVINPEPGTNPQPRPLFVPTGDPVPNPNYDPNATPGPNNQPWIQPGVRVTPSPTQSEPWRVDVQPVNRPQAGPEPLPDSQPDPENPDKPKPEEQQSLCEKHPDILACAKPDFDTPEGEIPKSNKDVILQEENLFGGGSCPSDLYFTPHGLQQLKVWDWNNACGYITGYVKPILIICCTFAAFMILIPGRTE